VEVSFAAQAVDALITAFALLLSGILIARLRFIGVLLGFASFIGLSIGRIELRYIMNPDWEGGIADSISLLGSVVLGVVWCAAILLAKLIYDWRRKKAEGDEHDATRLSKKTLKFALVAMTLIAFGALSVAFVGSRSPSQKAQSLVAEIDLDEIDQGTFVEVESQYGKVFALRDLEGERRVFLVPHHDGQYWLPDPSWERPYYPCKDFGPDSVGQKLVAGGLFRCRSSSVDWITTDESMTWEYSGENKAGNIEDMRVPKFFYLGSHMMIKFRCNPWVVQPC
jgi:hypothetical protein